MGNFIRGLNLGFYAGFNRGFLDSNLILSHRGDPEGVTSLAAKGTSTPTFSRSGTRYVKKYVKLSTLAGQSTIAVGGDGSGNCFVAKLNGTAWEVDETFPTVHGILNGCYAYSPSDIWVCGDSGSGPLLYWFNGGAWSDFSAEIAAIDASVALAAVHGSSSTNVFLAGDNGVVYKWDGSSWADVFDYPDCNTIYICVNSTNGKCYATGLYTVSPFPSRYIYSDVSGSWDIIKTSFSDQWGYYSLAEVNDGYMICYYRESMASFSKIVIVDVDGTTIDEWTPTNGIGEVHPAIFTGKTKNQNDFWYQQANTDLVGHCVDKTAVNFTGNDNPWTGDAYSIHIEAADDVWVCGASGILYHWDGNEWSDASDYGANGLGAGSLMCITGYSQLYTLATEGEFNYFDLVADETKPIGNSSLSLAHIACEPSESEICLYSNDPTNWFPSNVSTPSRLRGPVVGSHAYPIVEDPNTSTHYILSPINVIGDTSGQTVWADIILAAATRTTVRATLIIGSGTECSQTIDLANESFSKVTGNDLTYSNFETLGTFFGYTYKRVRFAFTSTRGAGNSRMYLYSTIGAAGTFAGSGTAGFVFAHAGIRIGTSGFACAPIITTSSTATKNADVFYYDADDGNIGGTGSDKKGTIRLHILTDQINFGANRTIFSLNDGGSSSDEVRLYIDSSGYVHSTITASGGTTRTVDGPETDILDGNAGGHYVQLTYEPGKAQIWVDKAAGAQNTDLLSADIPDEIDRMQYGYFPIDDERFYSRPVWRAI